MKMLWQVQVVESSKFGRTWKTFNGVGEFSITNKKKVFFSKLTKEIILWKKQQC